MGRMELVESASMAARGQAVGRGRRASGTCGKAGKTVGSKCVTQNDSFLST